MMINRDALLQTDEHSNYHHQVVLPLLILKLKILVLCFKGAFFIGKIFLCILVMVSSHKIVIPGPMKSFTVKGSVVREINRY